MRQLVPSAPLQQYHAHRHQLLQQLHRHSGQDFGPYAATFNPYPFALTLREYQALRRLQSVVHRAVVAVVVNYFHDHRIRSILQLSTAAASLLEPLADTPYRPGGFRPDFLWDRRGRPRLCEINARFAINSYYVSHYLNQVCYALPYLKAHGPMPVPALHHVPGLLADRLLTAPDVGLLKEREPGWDIHFLHREASTVCRFVRPADLRLHHGALHDRQGPLHRLLLELHQDELLAMPATLQAAVRSACTNDLRTIFLAHDKRLLAVLTSGDIMRDYLPAGEVRLLASHVVPTYLLRDREHRTQALHDQTGWLLKPWGKGKGEDILLGRECTRATWEEALHDENAEFVLQPFVEQKMFRIVTADSTTSAPRALRMHVVGLLPGFNEHFLGVGIFRAAPYSVVNVARGGTVLFPVLEANA